MLFRMPDLKTLPVKKNEFINNYSISLNKKYNSDLWNGH